MAMDEDLSMSHYKVKFKLYICPDAPQQKKARKLLHKIYKLILPIAISP